MNVLCVRLGAIGDVANALVVASAIKRAAPDARIGWAVHALSRPLVENNPVVDRVHVIERSLRPAALWRLRRELRRERYDVALDLQRLQKSALLARMSGARRIVGFDKARAKEQSWLWTNERIDPGPKTEHMVRQYMRFPARLGMGHTEPMRVLPRGGPEAERALSFRDEHGPPILLNLGASKPAKTWPPASFRELAESLLARQLGPVVLTGGPQDRAAATSVAAGLPVIDLVGKTSLRELWELCAVSRLMVTGDTGPMHLCAAVNTPVVAIFGPGQPARTGPFGQMHIAIRAGRALPQIESAPVESAGTPRSMIETDVEAVMINIERSLKVW